MRLCKRLDHNHKLKICLAPEKSVRMIDAFADGLDLTGPCFDRVAQGGMEFNKFLAQTLEFRDIDRGKSYPPPY